MMPTDPHARIQAHATCDQLEAAAPEVSTALYYRDEFARIAIVWRIGPAVLFGSLSWVAIFYLLFR